MMCKEQPGNPVAQVRDRGASCIHIGVVNNMPSSALLTTERQFSSLLDAAAGEIAVRISFYTLPGIPRSVDATRHIRNCYSNIEDLWNAHLDGIIVTGTEPHASNLKDEPYWGSLASLVEWAEHNTYSAIFSCLAAHAAVLQMDGIKRRPLADKRFGLFECAKVLGHPLTAGVPDRVLVPNSRWNDLPTDVLKACGYHVLTRSEDAGTDAFVRQRKNVCIFFQGHPEYDADTLLLEYRRDIRRFLRGERNCHPSVPKGYMAPEPAAETLLAQRERASSDRIELMPWNVPLDLLAVKVKNTWRPAAVKFYRNWLQYLCAQRTMRRSTLRISALPMAYAPLNTAEDGGRYAPRDT